MWRCTCAMVEALGEEGIIEGGEGVFVPMHAWCVEARNLSIYLSIYHALSSAATKNLGSFRTSLVCARRAFSSEMASEMLSEMPALWLGLGRGLRLGSRLRPLT